MPASGFARYRISVRQQRNKGTQPKPVHRLIYVAHPRPSHRDYGVVDGAFATCWVLEPVYAAADIVAREHLSEVGWDIDEADEHILVTDATCPPGSDGREYFEQAQIDGLVTVFYTWPAGTLED